MQTQWLETCAWRWWSVDRRVAPVVGQKFIGCGTVPLTTRTGSTAAVRQMEGRAEATKSRISQDIPFSVRYALGLAVQGRFD
jgi:hypothetical protein